MPRKSAADRAGSIRAGIGGWSFEPWRGVFYPDGLPHSKELQYASHHLATIEVNGTYYRTQKPATFASWAKESPDNFVFSLKGPRYTTNRGVLAEAGDSIARFIDSGITELGSKLGPLLWQLPPTKKFDLADVAKFIDLLPRKIDGSILRHAIEARHPSFCTPEFIELARRNSLAIVFAEHAIYPAIADVTADFIYLRLQEGKDSIPTGYRPKALGEWAERAKIWASGSVPQDVPIIDPSNAPPHKSRDVFVYFIHEGKIRLPAAAMAFQELISPAGKIGKADA